MAAERKVRLPPPPRGLPPVGRRLWQRSVRALRDLDALRDVDLQALERYCRIWCRWRSCMETIEKHGETIEIEDDKGRLLDAKPRPEVRFVVQYGDQLRGLERELGFSPSARKRIDIGQPEKGRPGRQPNQTGAKKKAKARAHDVASGPRLVTRDGA